MARVYKRDNKGRFGSGGGSSAPKAKDVSGAKTKKLQDQGQKNIETKAKSTHSKANKAWAKATEDLSAMESGPSIANRAKREKAFATNKESIAAAERATNAAYKASSNLPKDHPVRVKTAELLGDVQKFKSFPTARLAMSIRNKHDNLAKILGTGK
jgi:hypothetical protein